jgi:L-rhamnonate dehydratase
VRLPGYDGPAPVPGEADKVHWGHRALATPLGRYDGQEVRTLGGSDWAGYFVVEVEVDSGHVGIGVSVGGPAGCWVVEQHLRHFVLGKSPFEVETIWDHMFRGSLFYGRKGLVLHAISAIDLALWDVMGRVSDRPVYELLGGPARERLSLYATTPDARAAKQQGFIGCKLPLSYGLASGRSGLRANVERFAQAREAIGPDLFLAYDCWMGLDVETAAELGHALMPYGPAWLEECLPPDDYWGYGQLRGRLPRRVGIAGGEHEATRWGFRALSSLGEVDILQPDPSWCGGMTEMAKIVAEAETEGRRVVPHTCSAYAWHACFAWACIPFGECILASARGDHQVPQFGELLVGEPLAHEGSLTISDLNGPGFGLELNRDVELVRPTLAVPQGSGG